MKKFDISRTGTQRQPTSITNSRILLKGEVLEMFEAAFEAQIRNNNVTVTWFNNTMWEFMTSMCPTDVGEDITNWLLNIRKPRYIKVKEFVTRIKEINRFLHFLPPPFNTSLTQEELFEIIMKSIPSFESLFRTNNARTTITTLSQ